MRSLYLPFCSRNFAAAQVPFPFLADVADEEDVARRGELRRVERADEGEEEREPARVVADARRRQPRALPLHLHVGALGEDGVEVGIHDQHGSAGRRGAAAEAHDVAFGVHLDVAQPLLAQHLHERLAPAPAP